jgi:hypothetical protein
MLSWVRSPWTRSGGAGRLLRNVRERRNVLAEVKVQRQRSGHWTGSSGSGAWGRLIIGRSTSRSMEGSGMSAGSITNGLAPAAQLKSFN